MSGLVAWNRFYHTARWQRLRKHQLMQHPLCNYCLANGWVVPATVADHVKPHRGDWTAFCIGELQPLCEPCHKSTKQQIEKRGYCDDVSGSMACQSILITRSIGRAGTVSASSSDVPASAHRRRPRLLRRQLRQQSRINVVGGSKRD